MADKISTAKPVSTLSRMRIPSKAEAEIAHIDNLNVNYAPEKAMDVRPAVNAIMATSHHILKKIPEDQPLVIVMGECHDAAMHNLLYEKLLGALTLQKHVRSSLRFAFGMETNCNYQPDPSIDPDGRIGMQSLLDWMGDDEKNSPLLKFCLEKDISVSFNDVAAREDIYGGLVDQSCPLVLASLERNRPDLVGQDIYRYSYVVSDAAGIAVSNMFMAEQAADHIERTKARIYVQHCGMAHVLGGMDCFHRYPYEDSLTAQFLKRGFAVLPVLPNLDLITQFRVKMDGFKMLNQSVKIKGIEMGLDAFTDKSSLLSFRKQVDDSSQPRFEAA